MLARAAEKQKENNLGRLRTINRSSLRDLGTKTGHQCLEAENGRMLVNSAGQLCDDSRYTIGCIVRLHGCFRILTCLPDQHSAAAVKSPVFLETIMCGCSISRWHCWPSSLWPQRRFLAPRLRPGSWPSALRAVTCVRWRK